MERRELTLMDIQAMKEQGRKLTMLSICDYPMALIAEKAGIDMILVGDSLGMTALGYESTVPVTLEESLHHTKAVTRAAKNSFVIGDMPFMSYQPSERDAIINAGRFMKEGRVDAVKVEGGADIAHIVTAMVRIGIPVMGHVGLTPQSFSQLGGFKAQGTTAADAHKVIDDALAIQQAGAFLVILECVPALVSQIVTERLKGPTLGYGAGPYCDGQGLVAHDIIGYFDRFTPKFVKQYTNVSQAILDAFESYKKDVDGDTFPTDEHSFHIKKEQLDQIKNQ